MPVEGTAFADALARRYLERLAGETLMINELYLTLLLPSGDGLKQPVGPVPWFA